MILKHVHTLTLLTVPLLICSCALSNQEGNVNNWSRLHSQGYESLKSNQIEPARKKLGDALTFAKKIDSDGLRVSITLRHLAECELKAGNLDQALKQLELACQINRKNWQSKKNHNFIYGARLAEDLALSAKIATVKNEKEKSERLYKEALATTSKLKGASIGLRKKILQEYKGENRSKDPIVKSIDKDEIERIFWKGNKLCAEGKPDKGIPLLNKAVKLAEQDNPNNTFVVKMLTRNVAYFLATFNYKEALKTLRKELSIRKTWSNPDKEQMARLSQILAETYFLSGDKKEALNYFYDALEYRAGKRMSPLTMICIKRIAAIEPDKKKAIRFVVEHLNKVKKETKHSSYPFYETLLVNQLIRLYRVTNRSDELKEQKLILEKLRANLSDPEDHLEKNRLREMSGFVSIVCEQELTTNGDINKINLRNQTREEAIISLNAAADRLILEARKGTALNYAERCLLLSQRFAKRFGRIDESFFLRVDTLCDSMKKTDKLGYRTVRSAVLTNLRWASISD